MDSSERLVGTTGCTTDFQSVNCDETTDWKSVVQNAARVFLRHNR